MDVRDAVETDAEVLATIADAPIDVMRNLIHDRTVRVAEVDVEATGDDATEADATEADATEADTTEADAGEKNATAVQGFVSYDARDRTVHVTQFGGTEDACERLLNEPIRFARSENMTVELLVESGDETMRSAVEAAGFDEAGTGPTFRGRPTVRYRITPSPR